MRHLSDHERVAVAPTAAGLRRELVGVFSQETVERFVAEAFSALAATAG